MKKLNKRECLLWITIIILIGVVIYNGRKINDLEQQMFSMENRWMREISLVENSVLLSVKNQMQEQASLLTDIKYDFGELDVVSGQVPLHISILLKNNVKDMQLTLTFCREDIIMTANGNRFEAEVLVNLFLTGDARLLLTVKAEGEEKTEYLDNIYLGELWRQYLPTIRREGGTSSVTLQEDALIKAASEGNLCVDSVDPSITFTDYEIQTKVNGTVVDVQNITNDMAASEQFALTSTYPYVHETELSAALTDEISICLSAVDSLGYRHEYILYHYHRQSGQSVQAIYDGLCIYDSQGNLRYGFR